MESEEHEEAENTNILEGELLEDEILEEKNKVVKLRGGRRAQKTKAYEVQPRSKRSSQ